MPLAARCALVALDFLLLSSPAVIERVFGAAAHPFFIATVLLIIVNAALVWGWEPPSPLRGFGAPSQPPVTRGIAILAAALAAMLLFAACRSWIHEILIYPHDPQRADMLIVIQRGMRRVLQGANPYTIYEVPWPAPLPYGPVLWAPFLVPYAMHADVRFVTVLGTLFVPAACAIAAVGAAQEGRRALTAALLVLLAAIGLSAEVRHFASIGHTPPYWPLLAAFAWLVARGHWRAAAIAAGLLIVARTTMVSLAPVLLIAVWFRARSRFTAVVALLVAATVIPFLPFAIADPESLKYALYGSYQNVIKTFVWTSTSWVQRSIGITGRLLARRWSGAVEIVQVAVMLGVYVASWIAIRRGRAPLAWLSAALLAFSLTTLWPVVYVYFDVFLLLACAALAETPAIRRHRVASAWATTFTLSAAVVVLTGWSMIPVDASIDAGSDRDRDFLYAGFSFDEHGADRSFTWIVGTQAEILVPRRARTDAAIEIVCQPHLPSSRLQQMSASLNGTVLGTATLNEGWQTVSLPAPARAWQIGMNALTLSFSAAVSPYENGESGDRRRLSAAIDRLTVRTP